MKKLAFLLVVFVGVAFAFPPTFCNGCKPILSDKGVMRKTHSKTKRVKAIVILVWAVLVARWSLQARL